MGCSLRNSPEDTNPFSWWKHKPTHPENYGGLVLPAEQLNDCRTPWTSLKQTRTAHNCLPFPIPPTSLNLSPHSQLILDAICIFLLLWEAHWFICSVIYPISINQRLIVRQEKTINKNIAIRETARALKESWELMIAVGNLLHPRLSPFVCLLCSCSRWIVHLVVPNFEIRCTLIQ